MTTTLKRDGHIVIPPKLRQQRKLRVGDELEILVEDDEPSIIILRWKPRTTNEGLASLLRACPVKGFHVPKRNKDLPRDLHL